MAHLCAGVAAPRAHHSLNRGTAWLSTCPGGRPPSLCLEHPPTFPHVCSSPTLLTLLGQSPAPSSLVRVRRYPLGSYQVPCGLQRWWAGSTSSSCVYPHLTFPESKQTWGWGFSPIVAFYPHDDP